MAGSTSGKAAGRGGIVLTAGLSFVALLLVGVLVLAWLASFEVSRAKREWAAALGSFDEVMRRYPESRVNDAALRLERISATLGIDVAPRYEEERNQPAPEDVDTLRRFKRALGNWVEAELGRDRLGQVSPPPTEVSAFLDDHAAALDELRGQLLSGAGPVWKTAFRELEAAPLPNLQGLSELNRLLVTDALAGIAGDDRARALADVEASWRLDEPLRQSPILINQVVAMSSTRLQLGTLRHVVDVPPEWRDRLLEHDYRRSLLDAMKYEGWIWLYIDMSGLRHGSTVLQRLASPVLTPYARLCMAQMSEEYRQRVQRLEALGPLCDRDRASLGAELTLDLSSWNRLGEMMVPNLDGVVDRLARLELDLELTTKLIELAAARAERRGRWPPELPGQAESVACPKERWTYEVHPEGTATLALSREVTWPELRGVTLPTRVTVGP